MESAPWDREILVSAVRVERSVQPEGEKGGGLAPGPPGIGVLLPLSVLPFLAPAKQAWEAHEPGDLGIQWPRDPEVEIWNKTKRSNSPVYWCILHRQSPLRNILQAMYTSTIIWHNKF